MRYGAFCSLTSESALRDWSNSVAPESAHVPCADPRASVYRARADSGFSAVDDLREVRMKVSGLLRMLCAATTAIGGVATAATLQPLTNQPPAYVGLGPPFLLTDGSVMFQDDSFTGWWKLTPDASGSYLDGTWSELASFPADWNYGPYAYASAVLADGRVLIEGGEYNLGGPFSLTNLGAIYDPVTDSWTQVDPPPGWDFIGDSASIVMPNGKFLLGDKLTERIAQLDPATMTWTDLGSSGKADFNAEEGWTLLPDGSFITVDVFDAPNTERYVYVDAVGGGSWSTIGATPQSLAWNYHVPP